MIFVTSSSVPGGSSDRAIAVSFDDAATFVPLDLGVAGVGIVAPAHSVTRDETLFITEGGRVFRTTDGLVLSELTTNLGIHTFSDMLRVDELGLYFAIGTNFIKSSPDGETWADGTIPAGAWIRLAWNPYAATVTVGKTNNTPTSVAVSSDGGVTFALISSMGFNATIYELTQAANGVYMFGTRDENYTISTPDLTVYTQRASITSQLSLTYDPVTNLFSASGATQGAFTASPASLTWVKRSVGNDELYGGIEDLVPQNGGGFIGVRPHSGSVPNNHIARSNATGLTWSFNTPLPYDDCAPTRILVLPLPSTTTVPDVIGLTLGSATLAINGATLELGNVAQQESTTVPAGLVITQDPNAGTEVTIGSSVNIIISSGFPNTVPNVIGMTLTDGEITIRNAEYTAGTVTVTTSPDGPLGTIISQSPVGGTVAAPGTKVSLVVTSLLVPFNIDETVISQYSNSDTILRLVHNMAEYVDQRVNMNNFYNLVWNVDTAVGFGLDIWGNIVGVSRLLRLPSDDPIFGYINADDPPDWFPFNEGIFNPGDQATQAYLLPDDAFRTLILTKALANIVATNAASLNQLLKNLFPGRGKAYVQDLGGMAMSFVFEFTLTSTEYAILTQSGALPHPAGVAYSVVVVPADELFGFAEAVAALPFDFGVFYLPP